VALPGLLARIQASAHQRRAAGLEHPGTRRPVDVVVAPSRAGTLVGRAADGVGRPGVGTAAHDASHLALTASRSLLTVAT
jgi:hypothetical protein